MPWRILLAEERPEIATLLRERLAVEGFDVTVVRGGWEALASAAVRSPDAVLLDAALTGLDGIEVCRRIRSDPRTSHLPVLILSGQIAESDKVRCLEAGANDFVTRPFGLDEFAARVRVLLRNAATRRPARLLRHGRIELDLDRHLLSIGGRRVDVTAKELALLRELMAAEGRVVRRGYLLDRIWGPGGKDRAGERTVDAHIARLRQRLGAEGRCIVTVRGVGYRFDRPPGPERGPDGDGGNGGDGGGEEAE